MVGEAAVAPLVEPEPEPVVATAGGAVEPSMDTADDIS